MMDRAASMAESEMVDFLQEVSTRLMNGELNAVCLLATSPQGEEYQWWYSDPQAQTAMLGVNAKAGLDMGLEAIADEKG